jgi:two-component system sensor histidine kinase/response regulator
MLIPVPFAPDRPKLLTATVEEEQSRVAELEERLKTSEQAARELADSAKLYKSLFAGVATAVTIRSLEDQSFIDCNLAALRLYRADSVAQLRDSKPSDLSPETQADGTATVQALRVHVASAIEKGFHRSEWLARRLDGCLFAAEIRTAILELEGGRKVMQTLIEDITARKEAEAAQRRRAARDDLVARILRRFLDGNAREASRFATESLSTFFGVDAETVSGWLASPGALEAEDAALVRLVGEIVEMARAREQAQEELLSSEERYRMLVERSRNAILTFDMEGKVTFANPAASELAGYSAEEWDGLSVFDLVVPDERGRLAEVVEEARQGVSMEVPRQWSVRRKDGSVRRVESLRTPVRDRDGAIVGSQIVVGDITERHRTEQIRQAAQLELARASEEALAANRAKTAFVANMSHELRTPLNGVIGMVDLLAHTALDARQKRYVEVARASATLLLSVINDVLDFSKIEAGRLDLERIEFSFAEVIEEVTTTLELAAEEKGLELTCRTDPSLTAPLVGDPARLRQVLVNLITNAIKFTSRGEVAVSATLVSKEGDEPRVRVQVRDTGVGITHEAQRRLFKPFSQLDASTTRAHHGTGLGLAICRELVGRMGGDIGVESKPDEGSVFWFTLRLERPNGAHVHGGRADADQRLVGLRVIAVDDNATNREILRANLSMAGMECHVASSAHEALSMLVAAADAAAPYALALLDQHMPGVDGSELARRIRADPRLAAVRLVMLGSMGRPLEAHELEALGIRSWATKPIGRTQLLRALLAALADPWPASAVVGRGAQAPSRRCRLLLVEDNPINAEVAIEILRTAGYDVELVRTGVQAVESVKAGDYELVLMDCQLPGIDGYEATRRIRSFESSCEKTDRRVPIVALTASAALEDLARASGAGMDDHISKPVDARRLLDVVAVRIGGGTKSLERASRKPATAAIDLVRALSRLQGNRELLSRLVLQFRQEAARALARLRQGVRARDRAAVGYAAHRLRGQALSLDAAALGSELEALEAGASRDSWVEIESALIAVERELDRVLDALTQS